eukprot:scaffold86042_cov80-Cyclotella_meneghiniana.AAC.4
MTFSIPSPPSLFSSPAFASPYNVDYLLSEPSDLMTTTLSIRGGYQSDVYIRSSIEFFNGLRVPAAVLGSIIMKEMYALQNSPPSAMRDWDIQNRIDKSKGWRFVRYTYL